MNLDHVVDGDPSDGDQPGHRLPNVTKKPDYWPATHAVHFETRDGQHIPIGAKYQGDVDGNHVYSLLTSAVEVPPEEIALDGTDCDGNPNPATGNKGEIVSVVQAPGQVLTVRLCKDQQDREVVKRCDPDTGNTILIQYDVLTVPPTVLAATDLSTGEEYTGDLASLVICPDDDTESDSVLMCDEGTEFLRWVVKKNGVPTGVSYDTTMTGIPYSASGNEKYGACVSGCPPVTYEGVQTTW